MPDLMHLDANESAFFKRELEHVKAQSYDVKHKALKATTLIPVESDAPAGADTITWRSFDAVGVAKIVSDYAKDFPRVDVLGVENTVRVRSLGASYGYSIKEIRRSQMAGTRLDQRRANAARRAIDELIDSLAWRGDAAYGIQGLLDYPGMTEATIAVGAGSSKAWSAKTPDEIVADVTALLDAVTETTNGGEIPDTMVLPIAQYNLIANTRMEGGDSKTILRFILDNNPYLTAIDWVSDLAGAGDSGTDRVLVYSRDPEKLGLQIPMEFEQFEADKHGMEYEIPCHAETAGVIMYYPLSAAYGDGI